LLYFKDDLHSIQGTYLQEKGTALIWSTHILCDVQKYDVLF